MCLFVCLFFSRFDLCKKTLWQIFFSKKFLLSAKKKSAYFLNIILAKQSLTLHHKQTQALYIKFCCFERSVAYSSVLILNYCFSHPFTPLSDLHPKQRNMSHLCHLTKGFHNHSLLLFLVRKRWPTCC